MGHHGHGDETQQMATVRAAALRAGLVPVGAPWRVLSGGRTHLVWGIGAGKGLICKLLLPGRGTPLFPNRGGVEHAALQALAGSGLAPDPVAQLATGAGTCVLYRACPGTTWQCDAAAVGRVLARLHRHAAPAGLRWLARSPAGLLAQGDGLLEGCAADLACRLRAARPRPDATVSARAVFLHGDPVPGNIVMAPDGPVLIDWQCPALGDPLHDLALFLSPAMQTLGRGAALTHAERAAFLNGYDGGATASRLARWEPAFGWRMSAYCGWRIARGDVAYRPALAAELEHLEQLCQHESR